MAAGESRDGIEINGVAHVIFRVKRISECIAFYDLVMPFLGLKAVPPRSDFFVYYVGGRTAVAIREADAEHADVAHVETGPGLDHLCFRARSREDVDRARRIAGRHLADTQTYVLSGRPHQRIYALSPQALSRPRDLRHS